MHIRNNDSVPTIKCSLLMRIFAISQGLNALQIKRQVFREVFRLRSTHAQIFSNSGVIASRMLKGNSSKATACVETDLTLLSPLLHYRRVILRTYQYNYILEILCCCAN